MAPDWLPPGLIPFPVMGEGWSPTDYLELDLSPGSPLLAGWQAENMEELQGIVTACLAATGARMGWGGYLEHRALYRSSAHFGPPDAARSLHLGLDVWAPAGQALYAPFDGQVHSLADNQRHLDYGPTLILEHQAGEQSFFTLYGHLAPGVLTAWQPGMQVARGQLIAHLGALEENGGWPPHLHLQLIRDMACWVGDFPGVGFAKDREVWALRCPDPSMLLFPTVHE